MGLHTVPELSHLALDSNVESERTPAGLTWLVRCAVSRVLSIGTFPEERCRPKGLERAERDGD